MIVKSAEVIPHEENGGGIPVAPLHDCVDLIDCPVFTRTTAVGRVLVHWCAVHHPAYGGQIAAHRVVDET